MRALRQLSLIHALPRSTTPIVASCTIYITTIHRDDVEREKEPSQDLMFLSKDEDFAST
jgi:hypothetical protein